MPTRHPEWLDWELVLVDHVHERMDERGLDEVELRIMLEQPHVIARDRRPGRWRIAARSRRRRWVVVVEPEPDARCLVVVTVSAVD